MDIKQFFYGGKNRPGAHPRPNPKYDAPISTGELKGIFAICEDFQIREVHIGGNEKLTVTVCWLDGLVSGGDVAEDVVRPLTEKERLGDASSLRDCLDAILRGAVYSASVKDAGTLDDLVSLLVNGYCAIVFDSEKAAVCFESKNPNQRSIEQPTSEKSVKGAKDAFVEQIRTNTMLVRRKLRDPALKLKQTVVGRKSLTNVAVFYYDGVVQPAKVDELMKRLDAIDIDGLITAESLEEYIISSTASPFPQLMHTERPDRFAANILEGRVGVLVDGLPIGFMLPMSLAQLMRAPDDSSQHYIIVSALTLLRYFSLMLSMLLPAVFVAISMYHQEMIPTKMLLSMIQAKQEVPFGEIVEILGMLAALELLQEAGLRLPDSIGQTVSIIGALIVGQSAVEAKVLSPIAVIIVALAGIAGFTIPSQELSTAVRFFRLLTAIAAAIGGMYGLMAAIAMTIYHLSTISSFGLDYLSPISDRGLYSAIRAILRPPLRTRKFRDEALDTPDKRRQA